jgi:hypothetical protein
MADEKTTCGGREFSAAVKDASCTPFCTARGRFIPRGKMFSVRYFGASVRAKFFGTARTLLRCLLLEILLALFFFSVYIRFLLEHIDGCGAPMAY